MGDLEHTVTAAVNRLGGRLLAGEPSGYTLIGLGPTPTTHPNLADVARSIVGARPPGRRPRATLDDETFGDG